MTSHAHRYRHLDPDAAGSPVRLLPGLQATPATVTVIIGSTDAAARRGQLLAWATVNMLLRCYGVLGTVTVRCPDVMLGASLPRLSAGTVPVTLHQALADLAAAAADPQGRGPHLCIRSGAPVQLGTAVNMNPAIALAIKPNSISCACHNVGGHPEPKEVPVTKLIAQSGIKSMAATPAKKKLERKP